MQVEQETRPWYKNPYKFLDADDLELENPRRSAYLFFHDLLVNRPTEFAALFGLFLAANQHAEFTRKQQEAARLAIEAMIENKNPARHIAAAKQVSAQAAYQMLGRIDKKAKMLNFQPSVPVYYETDDLLGWQPTRQQIRKRVRSQPYECPGLGTPQCEGTAPKGFTLCYSCYQAYGLRGDWDNWLLMEVRDAEKRRYAEARNALYQEYQAGLHQPVAYRQTA